MLSAVRAVQIRGPATSPPSIARFKRDVRAALGADVPDRREPGLERPPRVDRRPHGVVERRLGDRSDDRVAGAFAGDVGVASMSPGSTVDVRRSMILAPAGVCQPSWTETMRSPAMRTLAFSRGDVATPSIRRPA